MKHKLIVMFVCLSISFIKVLAFAQDISLSAKQVPLETVLRQIEKQSQKGFFYNQEDLAGLAPVSITVQHNSIEQTLKILFKGLPLRYRINNNIIAISKVNPVEKAAPAQERIQISGEVRSDKQALQSVSIRVKGIPNLGTSTDYAGHFSLQVPPNSTLVFRSLGFLEKERTVGGEDEQLTVELVPSMDSLDEVVVVGYGTVRKKDLTGSVSTIKEDDIKATPVTSLDRAIQGRVAGVQVTSNSARPGGSTTIRIRGTGSINASNDPLYVIDGFPTGDLNSINPADIESMEILKDASATAIYGSRGSNGVVLITTKRGKSGQSNLDFNGYYGVQSLRHKIPLLEARDYAVFINEARINAGGEAYFDGSSAERPLPENIGVGTDWQDVVFRDAPMQNYQLSVNGGNEKTQYALSGGYYGQEGLIIASKFKRYAMRVNVDREVKSWLKMGLSMQGAHTNSNNARTETEGGASGGVTNAALNYAPVFPIYDSNGIYYRDMSSLNGNLVDNPLGIAKEVTDQYRTIRLLANAYAEIRFTKDLSLKTTFGGDLLNAKSNYYASRLIALGASANGSASISSGQNINWLNENTLTYKHTFGDKHDFSAVVGYTAQSYHNETYAAAAANFNNDYALYNNLGSGATLIQPSSGAIEWSLISYLARVNYGYDNRFLFTLTTRADGSSRFGPNHKYGFFPSGAFAWRVSNEKFFPKTTWLNDTKLRVSYGLTGNQAIGDYAYMASIVRSTAILGGSSPSLRIGGVPNIISNYDLGWESNKQLDIGLDVGFLNNKLQFVADYYVKNTADLLFSVNVPQTTGYSTSLSNIGQVQNKGLELALATNLGNSDGFHWSGDFNIAFNRNKIVRLDGRPQFYAGTGISHLQVFNTVLMKVGEPLGSFYGRVFDGIFQNQEEIAQSAQPNAQPGDIRYKDIDQNGKIDDNDRTIIGNGYPDYFAGFNNTFSYKGWDLNIFLQGSFGNEILNFGRFDLYNLNGNNNQSEEVLNRWTPTNPSNEIPRANALGGQRILSSFHIEDGSYLRLKNVSLAYTLPKSFTSRLQGRSIKVYVSSQNLWTLTSYKGYDPEVNYSGASATSQGMDYGSYPAAKTFIFGLNIGL